MAINVTYRNHIGLDSSQHTNSPEQTSASSVKNLVPGRVAGDYVKRDGSKAFSISGGIWGICGYKQQTLTSDVLSETIIRVRVDNGNIYVEKQSLTSDTFTEITQSANISASVGIDAVWSFDQFDGMLAIGANRVCKILDIDSGEVTRVGGSGPTTAPAVVAGGAGSLTGTFSYVYTFYDSTTGWESAMSDSASVTVTGKDVAVSDLETATDRSGVDKKRIYRTIDSGATYLFQSEIDIATTSFTDSTADSALGEAIDFEVGEHAPPPDGAYVIKFWQNRLWVAVGNILYYSDAYAGHLHELEYFNPLTRYFTFPQRITGLYPSLDYGKLLVFTPPGVGIYQIIPYADGSFSQDEFLPKEGTKFCHSISSNGHQMTWWGAGFPRLLTTGGLVTGYERRIANYVRPIVATPYDSDVYVWSEWSPSLNQFLYGITNLQDIGVEWVDSETGQPILWEDSVTGDIISWEVP